jgi:histidyl-tRNA synthetase
MKRKSMGNPSGFRDLLTTDATLKAWLVKTISDVYQKYGFMPIETPLVEFTNTLAGEVTDFNLYSVVPSKERQSGTAQSLSLRFDQTVPLARFVVDNMSKIALPFKRYVFGPVFRGETAQVDKGRYRQFDQFDVDIVGSSNIASDIEILLCMSDTMRAVVGDDKFVIRTNTRKLLNVLPKLFNFPEANLRAVLIELDKRDKVSRESLIQSLVGAGLSEENATRLADFGSISGQPEEVLNQIKIICGDIPEAVEAIGDLQTTADTLSSVGVFEIQFDMSIIRGLGYYTGMVFETNLIDAPQFGSVYSGGRYDGLVESFGVQALPAVGASVGVDRMIAALQSLGFQIPGQAKKAIVLIQDSSVIAYAFQVANTIRQLGVTCEVYTGGKSKLGDQFAYADKLTYDFTIVLGLNEMQNSTVNLKNQKTKTQTTNQLNSITILNFQ